MFTYQESNLSPRIVFNRVVPSNVTTTDYPDNRNENDLLNRKLYYAETPSASGVKPVILYPNMYNTMEEAFNQRYINIGTDNIFNNDRTTNNPNSIERIDILVDEGIIIKNPAK